MPCGEVKHSFYFGEEGVGRGGRGGAFRRAVETYDSPLLTESDFWGCSESGIQWLVLDMVHPKTGYSGRRSSATQFAPAFNSHATVKRRSGAR